VGVILNGTGDQDEILVINGVIGNHVSKLLNDNRMRCATLCNEIVTGVFNGHNPEMGRNAEQGMPNAGLEC